MSRQNAILSLFVLVFLSPSTCSGHPLKSMPILNSSQAHQVLATLRKSKIPYVSGLGTLPLCPTGVLEIVDDHYYSCKDCYRQVSAWDTAQSLGNTPHISGQCRPFGCCSDYLFEGTMGHFVSCKNGCCSRFSSLQFADNGDGIISDLEQDQMDLMVNLQFYINNEYAYCGTETGSGRCEVQHAFNPQCGPVCIIMAVSMDECVGRRTGTFPNYGTTIRDHPCSLSDSNPVTTPPDVMSDTCKSAADTAGNSWNGPSAGDGPSAGGGNQPSGDASQACFPAEATVLSKDGFKISMEDLEVGTEIQTTTSTTSRVILFTHSDKHIMFPFIQLHTKSNETLTASSGHFIYFIRQMQGTPILSPMQDVQIGDGVLLVDGSVSQATHVSEKVWRRGLFNPQTEDGLLLVDSIQTSAYTTAVKANTAHALLAPVRLLGVTAWKGMGSLLMTLPSFS